MTAGTSSYAEGPYTAEKGAILRVFGRNNEEGNDRSEEFEIYEPDTFDDLAFQVEQRREAIKNGVYGINCVTFEEFYEIVPADWGKLTKRINEVVEAKAKAKKERERAEKTSLAHRLLAEAADGV